jgi:hypothetical protein
VKAVFRLRQSLIVQLQPVNSKRKVFLPIFQESTETPQNLREKLFLFSVGHLVSGSPLKFSVNNGGMNKPPATTRPPYTLQSVSELSPIASKLSPTILPKDSNQGDSQNSRFKPTIETDVSNTRLKQAFKMYVFRTGVSKSNTPRKGGGVPVRAGVPGGELRVKISKISKF